MVRKTNAVASRKRRKKILKAAKGYYGDRKNHIRNSKNAVMSAMAFNYKHRKLRKRDFRSLWIIRINNAARLEGLSYSRFMDGLQKANIELNRKILSELAIHDAPAFSELAKQAKKALADA